MDAVLYRGYQTKIQVIFWLCTDTESLAIDFKEKIPSVKNWTMNSSPHYCSVQ